MKNNFTEKKIIEFEKDHGQYTSLLALKEAKGFLLDTLTEQDVVSRKGEVENVLSFVVSRLQGCLYFKQDKSLIKGLEYIKEKLEKRLTTLE